MAAAAPLLGAAETARLCIRVQEELAACAAHPALLVLVAQGCGKALRLFAERCEFACAVELTLVPGRAALAPSLDALQAAASAA